jgi:hypothetical protein
MKPSDKPLGILDSGTYLNLAEISSSYPDEWVLLANPVIGENEEILKAIVLYHSKDKREVCYKGRDKVTGYDKISVVFTGQHSRNRRIGIMKRVTI